MKTHACKTRGNGPLRGAFLRKMAFLGAGTVLSIAALELVVDRYLPVRGRIYVLDDVLLHDAAPSASTIQPMDPAHLKEGDVERVLVETGVEGFRGPSLGARGDRKRVLVLGDSLVMAENVPWERTFVSQLEAQLEGRLGVESGGGDSLQLVNGGRSGFGPDQSLLLFEERQGELAPDAIVFVLCAHNDHGDLMRNKLFRIAPNGDLERTQPVIGERIRQRFEESEARASDLALVRLWKFWRELDGAPAATPAVHQGIMNLYVRALSAQTHEHVIRGNVEVVSLFEDVYDIDVAAPASNPESNELKRALMGAVLARMVRRADDAGIPLIFMVVPSAVDVCDGFGLRVDPAGFPDYDRSALVGALMDAVGLAGGVAVDLTPALVAGGAGDPYFVGGEDIHWNSEGQRVAASFAAEELLRDPAMARALGAPDPTAPK